MKIQIVIPAINLWNKYSKPCIDSIKTSHEYRILFIDNASDDETRIEAGKMVSHTFAHQRNEEKWSCAKSWNFGVRDAFERGFDYVLILNNDILLHPEAIDGLVDRFIKEESNTLGMVTCMDVRGDCAQPSDIFNAVVKDGVDEAEHPNFSAFMINKKCWDEIGEFDEGFTPAYFEDNDYHHRIVVGGMRAIVYPKALFFHYGSRTQNESSPEPVVSGRAFEKNRDYFRGKWGGVPSDDGLWDHPFNNPINNIKWVRQING